MKKIFSLLLSFQLIIAPAAMANETPDYGGYQLPGTEETGRDATAGMGDAYLKTGTGSSGGYDFYVNQILVLATSSIGSSILTQCLEGLKTPSIATYMAGSLVHIASEILGAKAKNDRSKKKLKEIKLNEEKLLKKGDSGQKAALEQALKEELDNEDFLRNRKNWMTAITAIYTAAMGLAIAEEIYGLASGWSTGTALCSAAAAKCVAGYAACFPHCEAGIGALIAWTKANISLPEMRSASNTFCASFAPNSEGCLGFANLYINLVWGSCLLLPTDGGASMLSWSTLLSMAYGFGMANVGSGDQGGQISQYGSMLVSLLSLLVPSLSKTVAAAYNFPIPRSITFGASAALSGAVALGLAHREKVAIKNIVKLENTILNFEVTSTSSNALRVANDTYQQGGDKEDAELKKNNVKELTKVKEKNCIGKNGNSWDVSPNSCGKSFKVSKANFGKINIPTLNNVSNLASDMAQSLANGDEAGANRIATEIGTMAARVKQETEKLQAQYNDIQKKDKKPTLDFNKEIKARVASLQGELHKAAASKNMNLASLGPAVPISESQAKETAPEVTTAAVPEIALPEVDPLAGLGSEGTQDATGTGMDAAASAGPQHSLDDFESTVEDISKKSEVSIFKQVSNRYILNYMKFFNAKKEAEVVQEAPAAVPGPVKN